MMKPMTPIRFRCHCLASMVRVPPG